MFSKVKKLFSILAIAMMVTSVLPLNVLADETTTANTENVASASAEVQESAPSSIATTTNSTEVTTPSTETKEYIESYFGFIKFNILKISPYSLYIPHVFKSFTNLKETYIVKPFKILTLIL